MPAARADLKRVKNRRKVASRCRVATFAANEAALHESNRSIPLCHCGVSRDRFVDCPCEPFPDCRHRAMEHTGRRRTYSIC
jgi:hypothetical protein